MSEEELESFFVTEEEADQRLDKILAARLPGVGSRTYFQYLIDEGKVLLNGSAVKKRMKPNAGDEIEIEYICAPEMTLKPENIPLDVIYEDEHILVVNKPVGLVVHPAVGHWTGTFVNALLFHCGKEIQKEALENPATALRPGIVHRLDKDTSGVLLAAKNLKVQQSLIDMFINRRIKKEYLAICVGNPGSGRIEAPIGRHPINRKQMAVLKEGGRQAITKFQTQLHDAKLSLVKIELETGRTHQIRVHMRHHGSPVLGDSVYGVPSANAKYAADRQMLHAAKLSFEHPVTGKLCQFEAPVPADMQKYISTLEKK